MTLRAGGTNLRLEISGHLSIPARRTVALMLFRRVRPVLGALEYGHIHHHDGHAIQGYDEEHRGLIEWMGLSVDTSNGRAGIRADSGSASRASWNKSAPALRNRKRQVPPE